MPPDPADHTPFPRLLTAGVDGWLVQFDDRLSDPANRAALAFAQAVRAEGWPEVAEVASTLASVYLRFDPLAVPHDEMKARLAKLRDREDWFAAPLPAGRRLFHIPCVWGGPLAPQFDAAAAAAGLSPDQARDELSQTTVRVQTLGFSPGQPYLGQLPQAWDLPRQTDLTPRVPRGALVVAIRQFVLFGVSAPTGWQHIGQTAARPFDGMRAHPFLLRPGDEVRFPAISDREYEALLARPDGGITQEDLP